MGNVNEEPSATEIIKKHKKESKDMTRKEFIEKVKTVSIAVMATLLIAGPFIWQHGVKFGETNQNAIQFQAKEIVSNMNTVPEKK